MITFRQTTNDDIPVLLEILAVTLDSSDALGAGFKSDDAGWVACLNGRPVGFGLANSGKGELLIIAVLPESAGQGIGQEVMKQAEAWLFSHGWGEVRLKVTDDSDNSAGNFFRHLGWSDWKMEGNHHYLKKANPRSIIKLEEHVIADDSTGYTRLLRLQRGPSNQPHRLCLFLDGEHYWRDMDAIPLLNDLLQKRNLPPMTLALVGHVSGAARHEDYTCNEGYAHYIGNSVVPWLKREISGLQDGGHIICGLSLSGLMAAYQTLRYPQHFSGCLSQSGSHWWKHEWFAEMARQQAPTAARFWLSVGDQETEVNVKHPPTGLLQEISQIAGVEKAAQIIKEIGGTIHYHQYHGGHSLHCWHDELSDALLWLVTEEMQNKRMQPAANAVAYS